MMKKTVLTTGLIAFAFSAFAQFTADRLVVSQYSDAAAEAGKGTAVKLIEFNLLGVASTTGFPLALPTANSTGVNAFAGKGGSYNEGLVTLSSDGNYLSLFGYNLAPGGTPATGAPYEKRVIARVDVAGVVNTTTLVAGSASNKVAQPRVAITNNGTGFWAGSSGSGGVRYVLLGATGTVPPANTASDYGADVTLAADLGAIRSLNIFNGQLYETTVGSKLHFATVSQGTNNLPTDYGTTTTTTLTTLPGFTTALPVQPNQAVILKSTLGIGAPDVIYIANDVVVPAVAPSTATTSVIEKYVLVSGTWTAKGTTSITGSVRGITGRIVGGTAFIYAVTSDAGASTLITISDLTPASGTLSTAINAPTVLATAPADNVFKGVSFTPGTSVLTTLPIKLSSFTGKSALNGVQLSWVTSSEENNNHFDILRSTDGKVFTKIDEVVGANNSTTTLNYAFLDKTATKGANYYKLNQIDNDGKSEEFGPVVVTVNGQPADFSVYADKANGQIKVNVYANQAGDATVNIYDTNGRVIATQKINLQAGNNEVSLTSQNAGAGLHIASLTVDGVTLTKKFLFQ